MIYLDNGATSFRKPPGVYRAVERAMYTCANPGRGGYGAAMEASETVYACREAAGALFHCRPEQVALTTSCTHGLNIAIRSVVKPGGRVIVSGFEHNAVTRPLHALGADIRVAGRRLFDWEDTLSRFGREHVMMDYYLEFLFPEKRVRYIAVAENEDTEKGLSDFVPFKNLFNEWFAKDTSRNVKAAFKAKFATGQRIGAYAPIGYRKHPEIKNKLIIDEETRWIVEKIFDLAIHGRGAASITRILIMEKVPTPGFINFQRDGTFANIYAGAPEEKSYAWTIAQVKSIMKDETYIGHTIHYRETNISFKNKRRIRKPQSEWVRVENTQEPIISEQVFRQVQEQIANRRRKCKDGTTQIFSGLVKCADCGWSLSYGENRQNSKPYGHYHCSKYGQGTRQCSMHYIRYDVLYAYVLSRLQYWSRLVQHDEERLLKRLLNANDKGQAAARKKQAAELNKAEKRKAEVDTLFARMYEDWAAGRITEYNFSMLSGKYQSEQAELDTKIEQLQSAIATESQNAADAEKWIALMKECVNPTELTAELLNTLIEKIVVHEAVKGEDGSREQEVEIFYRFIGKID